MHTAFIRVKVAPSAADRAGATPHVAAFLTEIGPLIEKWEYNHTAAL